MILKKNLRKIKLPALVSLILITLAVWCNFKILAAETKTNEMETGSGRLISKVAPGEFLPISVKLINFGEGRRVDVDVDYQILNSNNVVVFSQSETVAVETTASFVKNIQIPLDLSPGKYIASSKITYEGQEVPAISKFEFTVERKIAGIFVSQFILYGTVTILVGIVFAVLSRLIIKRRACRLNPHEYSDVPKEERLFYEIISDIIMQMRYRAGDRALEIAGNIEGLVIGKENGRVLKINKDPAEIVAVLILQYQNSFGKKMVFSPRKSDKETKELLLPVEKNLDIIKKYFDK
ncbi:MAG: hypothetical protein NT012_03580 [Candidatus Nealsonbacteria bacterium]|nr:hypothetical protein [Candidatus Nealsonbacteria bacterium]